MSKENKNNKKRVFMNRSIEREHWKKLLVDHAPYKYLITVTFRFNVGDNEAIQLFNKLLRFSNRKIYGGTALKKNRHMTGFVFAERQQKRLTKQEIMFNKFKANNIEFIEDYGSKSAEQTKRSFNRDATLHFHMLVKDDLFLSRFSMNELRHLIIDRSSLLKKKSLTGDDYCLFDERGIDIREITDIDNLSDYLTKEMKFVGSNNISPLDKYGACFIAEDLKRSA